MSLANLTARQYTILHYL